MNPIDPTIAHGGHTPNEGLGCVMEWTTVRWLMSNGWSLTDAWRELSDAPPCTAYLVYKYAQLVNDTLGDEDRQRLGDMIPRLMRCHEPADDVAAHALSIKMLTWLIRQYSPDFPIPEIDAEYPGALLNWVYQLNSISHRDELAPDPNRTFTVTDVDLIAILDELLDLWEKELVELGAMLDAPPAPSPPVHEDEETAA